MSMIKRSTMLALGALLLFAVGDVAAQQQPPPPPPRESSETNNFGIVPFANPQIIITKAEDRVTWRALEDRHLKELRALEDKYDAEFRALRLRQAAERDEMLKKFTQ